MSEGRIPAQCVSSFSGQNTVSSTINEVAEIIHQNDVSQPLFLSGNRCNHDNLFPKFAKIPKKHKKRFPVIQTAITRIVDAYRYPVRYGIGKLFYNPEKSRKDGSFRKRRGEIRQAITCMVGYAILHSINLANMALGFISNGMFKPFGVEYISKLAGSSIYRTRRALKVYQDAGYISIIERKYMLPNGEYRSETPIITVSPDLFYDLDIPESDLAYYQNKNKNKEQKEIIQHKSKELNLSERKAKKARKIAMKTIREILGLAKAGKPLQSHEKALLEKEMPGYERSVAQHRDRSDSGLYRDYTDVSRDQFDNLDRPSKPENFLGHISRHAQKLKDDS